MGSPGLAGGPVVCLDPGGTGLADLVAGLTPEGGYRGRRHLPDEPVTGGLCSPVPNLTGCIAARSSIVNSTAPADQELSLV